MRYRPVELKPEGIAGRVELKKGKGMVWKHGSLGSVVHALRKTSDSKVRCANAIFKFTCPRKTRESTGLAWRATEIAELKDVPDRRYANGPANCVASCIGQSVR